MYVYISMIICTYMYKCKPRFIPFPPLPHLKPLFLPSFPPFSPCPPSSSLFPSLFFLFWI